MKLKKIALVALAVVLIAGLSVAGTMALLKQNTAAVTNTFQAYNIGPDDEPLASTFTLQEHELEQGKDGSYTLSTTDTVNSNTYDILPGVVLPKDPYVTIGGRTAAPARLFVEVVGELPESCAWELDEKWELLNGVTGAKGGKVYVWNEVLASSEGNDNYNIIKDKEIVVDGNADLSDFTADTKITFYAYLAQATVSVDGVNSADPATIYTACFK